MSTSEERIPSPEHSALMEPSTGSSGPATGKSENTVVTLVGISKSYGNVRALQGVNFSVAGGRVDALLGENGAGKSTLIKILTGVVQPDEGRIVVEDQEYEELTPRQASSLGIAAVTQELSLFPDLSVAANALIGREPRGKLGLINYRSLNLKAKELISQLGVQLDSEQPVRELGFAERQLVEIAKALSKDPKVLILDEPTSGLREAEVERLFEVVRGLRESGKSVVFIGHRMSEVLEIADRITVLKDGERVGELARDEAQPNNIVQLMVGREVEERFPDKLTAKQIQETQQKPPLLEAKDFSVKDTPVSGVDLSLWAGQVCGLAGLRGQGQTELLEGLFGVLSATGSLRASDTRGPFSHPAAAIGAGLALVPEDRKNEGLVLDLSVRENLSLACMDNFSRALVVNRQEERDETADMVKSMDVRPSDPEVAAGGLSGGNQQKVALGKWLLLSPKVLLLADPTRGVDIATKQEIYRLVRRLADDGLAILYLSTDLTELIGLCDRVLVMFEGRIQAEFEGDDISEERIAGASVGESPA